MWKFLGILIIIWLAFSVIGFVIKGLLWLAVIGIILFLATAVYGIFKERSSGT